MDTIIRKKIEKEHYARLAHFSYFQSLANPYVGITINVDITDFLSHIKEKKQPFFLSFLYAVATAANQVPQLRQRIIEDEIYEYSFCKTSHTVAKEDETYSYCVLDERMPFSDFLPEAKRKQEEAKRNGSIEEDPESISYFFISSTPWLSYASIVLPTPSPADSNPRITWGKYFLQNERVLIPVTLLCHHALVDGLHMARFYEALNECSISNFV
ncbi:MAG: chloramphenicol O-acetyltransferase type [Clostridiales bacterium]|nr:chloramphenicol O-acetyltransferase type [Clostridiales bacterium]